MYPEVSWNNGLRKLPQVWALRSGSCYKLGSVESDGVVKEKEVAMLSVYNQSYLALSVGEEVICVTRKDYYEDGWMVFRDKHVFSGPRSSFAQTEP